MGQLLWGHCGGCGGQTTYDLGNVEEVQCGQIEIILFFPTLYHKQKHFGSETNSSHVLFLMEKGGRGFGEFRLFPFAFVVFFCTIFCFCTFGKIVK